MKASVGILKGFAYVWGSLAALAIVAGIIGIWMTEGFGAVQDTFSPFNVWNWLATAIILSPAIGAFAWADKLDR